MEIITRAEARELGLTRYFTGKPCKHGHIVERRTNDGKCMDCAVMREMARPPRNSPEYIEYRRAYREKNKEAISAKKAEHHQKNKSAINERRRSLYAENAGAHREAAKLRRLLIDEAERKKRARDYRSRNIERLKGHEKAYRESNRDVVNGRLRQHYAKNKGGILERKRSYNKENPHVADRNRGKRRARQRSALPEWYGELDSFVWQEASHIARRRLSATGIKWSADHMVPVAAKTVCGLHVWNNCQVIPASLNLSKNNKLILTEPLEWLKFI